MGKPYSNACRITFSICFETRQKIHFDELIEMAEPENGHGDRLAITGRHPFACRYVEDVSGRHTDILVGKCLGLLAQTPPLVC